MNHSQDHFDSFLKLYRPKVSDDGCAGSLDVICHSCDHWDFHVGQVLHFRLKLQVWRAITRDDIRIWMLVMWHFVTPAAGKEAAFLYLAHFSKFLKWLLTVQPNLIPQWTCPSNISTVKITFWFKYFYLFGGTYKQNIYTLRSKSLFGHI